MNLKRLKRTIIRGALLASLPLVSTSVFASPIIDADIICDPETGDKIINYVSTSWIIDVGGANTRIDITVDGTLVESGAYTDPDYAFSGSVQTVAPTGTDIVVASTAIDDWGTGESGGQTSQVTVTVPEDCGSSSLINGRFTGGGHQIRVDGVRVTRGLTIHCDLLLSNNLEINWQGNQFHTTEHLTTIECSDDPAIIQAPPPAPLDTLIGIGEGRYNGEDGYTIEFVLRDFGEPGREDEAAFLVYPNGDVGNPVLDVPLQKLSGGNLQAHADQPHK